MTFTDCVNCLIAFTNNRVSNEISLNGIALLQLCATKLAEGDVGSSLRNVDKETSESILTPSPKMGHVKQDRGDMDDHFYFWFHLLAGKLIYAIFLCLVVLCPIL